MADFQVDEEVIRTVKGVTLTLSVSEAGSLLHLLSHGVGGKAATGKGDLGAIMGALKGAFGLGKWESTEKTVDRYSRIDVTPDYDLGYVVADIRD